MLKYKIMEEIRLSHKIYPKLLITPQLKQALYILQLRHNSLKEYLEQEIAKNPLLQSLDRKKIDRVIQRTMQAQRGASQDNQYSFDEISNEQSRLRGQELHVSDNTSNLQDYLLRQLRMGFLSEEELSIAQELISNIDNNGYLRITPETFAKECNLPPDKIEKILKTTHSLEPSGIGAKNLQECLLIQLKDKDQEQSLAYKIIQSCFKELSRKKYHVIAKKLNVSIDEVKKAVKEITFLNPRPGAAFFKEIEHNIAITPDIFFKKHKNNFQLILNNDGMPKLKINSTYKKLLKNPSTSEETKEFIKNRLKSALWLVKAMEQRRINTLKVINTIAKIQKQTLCKNLSYLKPLGLKKLAQKTGLHLSTVGRIISHKYISTPQGIIKLKELLSQKLISQKGADISKKNVLSKMHKMILSENKKKPLSDQMISEGLKKKGINISRRTVAKYRELLKIPPAFLR